MNLILADQTLLIALDDEKGRHTNQWGSASSSWREPAERAKAAAGLERRERNSGGRDSRRGGSQGSPMVPIW